MQVIDYYQLAIEAKCKAMELENMKLKYLQNSSSLLETLIDKLKENAKEIIKNSPLNSIAEDWLSEQINNASTEFINKVTSEIEEYAGKKLSKFRNSAFKVISSAMCLNHNLIYYFAMQSANKIVKQCDENIRELKKIKSEIQKLHNIINTIGGLDNKYVNNYFDHLKEALKNLSEASKNIKLLKSGYLATDYFNIENFTKSKKLIDSAANLILKKKNNSGTIDNIKSTLQSGNINNITDFMGLSSQYSAAQALWQIPKYTVDVMNTLKKNAQNVSKINILLTSFYNINGPDSGLYNWYKSSIIEILNQSIELVDSLCKDMSLSLFGNSDFDSLTKENYTANNSQIMLKIPEWGARVYFLKAILNSLDYESLKKQNEIGKLKSIHEKYKGNLTKINLLKKGQATLKAEEAREVIGDLESEIFVFCGQVTSSLFEKTVSTEDNFNVQLKTKKIMDRIDLSIDLTLEIKKNMASYANETKKELGSVADIGESVLNLCDSAGLDRLKDVLESGEIATFLKMNETVATYAGAALASLNTLTSLTSDRFSLNIIEKLKHEVLVELRSKELIEKTSFQNSASTQISKNDIQIESLKGNLELIKKTSNSEGFAELLGISGPKVSDISSSIYTPFSKSFGF